MTTHEIRWHGRGGQGVVTANEILAGAALLEGKYMKAFPEFGPERMGAPIRAFARISDEPIKVHSQVYFPDYVIVLDPTLIGNVNVLEGMKANGALVANYAEGTKHLKEALGTDMNVRAVDATQIALETIGRPMANTAMLGALVRVSNIVKLESVLEELRNKLGAKLPEKVVEKNILSVQRAYDEVD
ncbi:MAG TPA: 2-oxoacid:acceptor oxidoreductase family protein [Methanomassiliicoccaceae archaeon]|nr:pyruvate synthase [Euryarchaeota archaeon]HOB38666.1 2-oxoacid:acceptor oxidoreductase family protein [Methanomassiliicoccaceae archaeon]HOL07197.1 2-oxoacid:acceptor oxidoreductase family protein [Methanomassiliicoccaceae archaeon]HOQ26638.1 2-oxoacid:acceptor oxidoreductase family protein [Methanomassiliicoccaceae archaeon]HPP45128.1 2-oxoacid:acceptor oxidoreductase family protein [Methanomassiliicoccaceae archaeon]